MGNKASSEITASNHIDRTNGMVPKPLIAAVQQYAKKKLGYKGEAERLGETHLRKKVIGVLLERASDNTLQYLHNMVDQRAEEMANGDWRTLELHQDMAREIILDYYFDERSDPGSPYWNGVNGGKSTSLTATFLKNRS